jgi:hypothetical protein
MTKFVGVICKCKCMAFEFAVNIRHREDGEDIREWMTEVQKEITRQHQKLSPLCVSPTLDYAKIPMPENAAFIGGVPKLNS